MNEDDTNETNDRNDGRMETIRNSETLFYNK